MKKFLYDINTTQLSVSSGGQPISEINGITNGDSILFAAHFTEVINNNSPTDLDLTDPGTPLALRYTIRASRDTDARLWGFQDAFNQGNYTAGEVLTEGRVTWLVNLGFMSYLITGGTSGASGTFIIDGDYEKQIIANDIFTVSGSVGDNGNYVVASSTYSSGSDETTITVVGTVPAAGSDGQIDHSALDNDLIAAGVNAGVEGFTEVSLLDSNSVPQTLSQLVITITDELDNGANSVSAAQQPFYLTSTETAAAYQTKLYRDGTNIDALAAGAFYDLYTVPTGKWAIPLGFVEIITEVTGAVTTMYDYKMGTDSSDALYRADAISNLGGLLGENEIPDLTGFVALMPGEIFRVTITNPATVATSMQVTFIPIIVEIDLP